MQTSQSTRKLRGPGRQFQTDESTGHQLQPNELRSCSVAIKHGMQYFYATRVGRVVDNRSRGSISATLFFVHRIPKELNPTNANVIRLGIKELSH